MSDAASGLPPASLDALEAARQRVEDAVARTARAALLAGAAGANVRDIKAIGRHTDYAVAVVMPLVDELLRIVLAGRTPAP